MSRLQKLNTKFPCREKILNELYNLIGDFHEYYPNAIYLFGHAGTGKTTIIQNFLKKFSQKFIVVNCIECYTNRILFESILRKFQTEENDKFKCDNFESFINELSVLDDNSYIICLDNAERIRDMDLNILSGFLRLQELTGLNICTILLSQLAFEKFYPKTGLSEIINIYLPQYSKQDIQKILLNEFEKVKNHFCQKLAQKANDEDEDEYRKKKNILENLNLDFYENYINVFLSVFYQACRDLPELRMVSRDCFQTYCEPVLNGEIENDDVQKLWRNISMPLKTALSRIYMRVDNLLETPTTASEFDNTPSVQKLARQMELPYYAKFLLIAAFLASHNAAKDDKRLFVKNNGKQRKRMQTVNAQAKVQDKMSTSLGPKSFSVDRLLAIFYAILEEKVGLSCNLLSQISSLTQLKLLTFASGENNIMEGSAKLQCTVGLDFIIHVGKTVGFNVRQYLSDFM